MFVTKAKYRAAKLVGESIMQRAMQQQAVIHKLEMELFLTHKRLQAAMRKPTPATTPFTKAEINQMIKTNHPDRNGCTPIANAITAKLLAMRKQTA